MHSNVSKEMLPLESKIIFERNNMLDAIGQEINIGDRCHYIDHYQESAILKVGKVIDIFECCDTKYIYLNQDRVLVEGKFTNNDDTYSETGSIISNQIIIIN